MVLSIIYASSDVVVDAVRAAGTGERALVIRRRWRSEKRTTYRKWTPKESELENPIPEELIDEIEDEIVLAVPRAHAGTNMAKEWLGLPGNALKQETLEFTAEPASVVALWGA